MCPDLFKAAKEVQQFAFAQYSDFRVGAAATFYERETGLVVVTGCNAEFGAGQTFCAERVLILNAITQGLSPHMLREMVVVTPRERPATSCGACRQVLMDCAPEAKIFFASSLTNGEDVVQYLVKDLLPDSYVKAVSR